jgi:predicted ArsR family transcriptional regulator
VKSLRRAEAVLDALALCPATAYELGVELGWPTRLASAWVSCLLTEGLVEHRGKVPSSFESARPPFLYGLTKSGEQRRARGWPTLDAG